MSSRGEDEKCFVDVADLRQELKNRFSYSLDKCKSLPTTFQVLLQIRI